MTIHLVYAKGIRRITPQAITRELAAFLADRFPVKVYDLAEIGTIHPEPGDILLGHPQRDPRTIFTSSFHQPGWARRIIMCPYSHGIPEICAWLDPLMEEADSFLAITGKPWFDTMDESVF